MHNLYPLKPVISCDPLLAQRYNADPQSVLLTSACLTSAEATTLLAQGAIFQDIVLVNGAGEDVVALLGDANTWDSEIMPSVRRTSIIAAPEIAVAKLHDEVSKSLLLCGAG